MNPETSVKRFLEDGDVSYLIERFRVISPETTTKSRAVESLSLGDDYKSVIRAWADEDVRRIAARVTELQTKAVLSDLDKFEIGYLKQKLRRV